jgi:hypothetical protein
MVNDVIWKELEGHLHVLVLIKWGFKIHIIDIRTNKSGCQISDDTVPHNFCRVHVGCTCSEFVQIIDEVATIGDTQLIWVVLLGAVVDDDSRYDLLGCT